MRIALGLESLPTSLLSAGAEVLISSLSSALTDLGFLDVKMDTHRKQTGAKSGVAPATQPTMRCQGFRSGYILAASVPSVDKTTPTLPEDRGV